MTAPHLTPDLLLHAYAMGVFPMSEGRDDPEVFWVDPEQRGILPLDGFHISRRLARRLNAQTFNISFNSDFNAVVAHCADRKETWINDTIADLYAQLHDMGHAHSIEIRQDGTLVGGVYGVALGGAFFGESMFSTRTDASKIALAYLTDRLRICGFTLFDTQFITAHLATLGAIEISRATYRKALQNALKIDASFDANAAVPPPQEVLQRNAQTS